MYSSMHGEQIELRQAYAGALSAAAARPSTATCISSTGTATEPAQSQVRSAVTILTIMQMQCLAKAFSTMYGNLLP